MPPPPATPQHPAPVVGAGWYPDPERPGWSRFWTGEQWSSERRPAEQAPPPPRPTWSGVKYFFGAWGLLVATAAVIAVVDLSMITADLEAEGNRFSGLATLGLPVRIMVDATVMLVPAALLTVFEQAARNAKAGGRRDTLWRFLQAATVVGVGLLLAPTLGD